MRVVKLIEEERDAIIFLERTIDRNGEPLSLGERQRVQLVRALLTRPKLLLMDEALSGIAEEAEVQIVKWLIAAELKDAIVLYASHRPAIQALFPTRICLDELEFVWMRMCLHGVDSEKRLDSASRLIRSD